MSSVFETHGAPSWIELHTNDVTAAKKFYTDVLGWQIEGMEMQSGGTYEVIKAGDERIGGLMTADHRPTRWVSYVTVDNVDERTAKAKSAGAKIITEPEDIPGVGRISTIEDPTGAAICLITYGGQ